MSQTEFDVLVVGGGNAALTAALSAQEQGGKILLIEKSPKINRGGNSAFSGGLFRTVCNGKKEVLDFIPDISETSLESYVIPKYTEDDYYTDIMRSTLGRADPELSQIIVSQSNPTLKWMTLLGVKFELMVGSPSVRKGDILYFEPGVFLQAKGAGLGLVNQLFDILEKRNISILYETKMVKLILDGKGKVCGAKLLSKDGFKNVSCGAVILACGGFSANPEMRTKYLGQGWDIVKVRGSRFNTGEGLQAALEIGAQPAGQWSGCHCSIQDANSPNLEIDKIAGSGSRYSYQWSIMVNMHGQRFIDEGEDLVGLTYAKFGKHVLEQDGGIAYQIFDDKVKDLLMQEYQTHSAPIEADSVDELAEKIDLDSDTLGESIRLFNSSVRQDIVFDPTTKDGKHTQGISPRKSNWAQKIDVLPLTAYAVTGAITFTFGGINVNKRAQVINTEGNVISGLFATGELSGFYFHNYPGASGLMRGAIFGRIAGINAAAKTVAPS